MTERPAFEWLLEEGKINHEQEITLRRYAVCRRAMERTGWKSLVNHSTYLTSQYARILGSVGARVRITVEELVLPRTKEEALAIRHEWPFMPIAGAIAAVAKCLSTDPPRYMETLNPKPTEKIESPDVQAFLRRERVDR